MREQNTKVQKKQKKHRQYNLRTSLSGKVFFAMTYGLILCCCYAITLRHKGLILLTIELKETVIKNTFFQQGGLTLSYLWV